MRFKLSLQHGSESTCFDTGSASLAIHVGHAVKLPQIQADSAGKPFAHARLHASDHTRTTPKGNDRHVGIGGPVQDGNHVALVPRPHDEIRGAFEIVVKRPDIVRE